MANTILQPRRPRNMAAQRTWHRQHPCGWQPQLFGGDDLRADLSYAENPKDEPAFYALSAALMDLE